MAQVVRPQRRPDEKNTALSVGGGVAGFAMGGGPAGALLGAQIGGTAGGLLNPPQPDQAPLQSSGGSSAIARRMQQMAEDRLQILKESEAALPTLPEHLRQQYAPAIVQARILEERSRGIA